MEKKYPIMGWTSLYSCFYNVSHNDEITSNPNHPSKETILIKMFCDKAQNKFPKKQACKNIESENSIFLWSSIILKLAIFPPFQQVLDQKVFLLDMSSFRKFWLMKHRSISFPFLFGNGTHPLGLFAILLTPFLASLCFDDSF